MKSDRQLRYNITYAEIRLNKHSAEEMAKLVIVLVIGINNQGRKV